MVWDMVGLGVIEALRETENESKDDRNKIRVILIVVD